MKRRKIDRKKSEKLFTNTARAPHPKNTRHSVMRGGYRL